MLNTSKKILICPLDWGLGHATRCIPIIEAYLNEGCEVLLGGSGQSLAVLRERFPELECVVLPCYNIVYPKKTPLALALLLQIPKIILGIAHEYFVLKGLVLERSVDVVVSDNRYGLFNSKAYCVFITHQLSIPAPIFVHGVLQMGVAFFCNRFDATWVPDVAGSNSLAGALSKSPFRIKNLQYIGILSRFEPSNEVLERRYKTCMILSGPEPERTVFERALLRDVRVGDGKVALVRGLPKSDSVITHANIDVYNHLSNNELKNIILSSGVVFCRAGYSTLMDLSVLQKPILVIPTKGQKEQEYLAKYHKLNATDPKILPKITKAYLGSSISATL